MIPLPPSILQAIQDKDAAAITNFLCDPNQGKQRKFLWEAYSDLMHVLRADTEFVSPDEDLYSFPKLSNEPSAALQRLIEALGHVGPHALGMWRAAHL